MWITGLSGSGKTTLARALRKRLERDGRSAIVLDGDELRATISIDLGFSKQDRDEHVARVSRLALDASRRGQVAIVALISPYREARQRARELASPEQRFIEVYLQCPIDELRRRDPKGLYRLAETGAIAHFTGVSDPYEPPLAAEVTIDTASVAVDAAVDSIVSRIQ